jgi:hypothetical protein
VDLNKQHAVARSNTVIGGDSTGCYMALERAIEVEQLQENADNAVRSVR